MQKGSEFRKNQSLKKVLDEAAKIGIDAPTVTAIIGWRYSKGSSKELTADEAQDLANNLEKYFKEMAVGE